MNPKKSWEVGAKHSPSQQELDDLYKDLSGATDRKPTILSLVPPMLLFKDTHATAGMIL